VTLKPFADLPEAVASALAAEASDVRRFFGSVPRRDEDEDELA